MSYLDLGEVLTIINGMPYKFRVSGQESQADSSDLLNQFPYFYHFNDLILKKGSKQIDFVVTPTDQLIDLYFNGINESTHINSIKFGLSKIQEDHKEKRFKFLTTDFEKLKSEELLSGENLRKAILNLVANINKQFPRENIRDDNLLFKINGNKDEIYQWAEDLFAQDYFLQQRIGVPQRGKGGTLLATFYTLNPKKREEIFKELEKSKAQVDESSLMVFLSYSTRNKVLAGRIKTDLETLGIDVFMAHETIKISKKWEDEILLNLQNCDVFIPIITANFRPSKWTDQEAGIAIAGNKVIISLYTSTVPHGFLNRYQGLKFNNRNLSKVISKVIGTIKEDERTAKQFQNCQEKIE